jgi:hypothetical protein
MWYTYKHKQIDQADLCKTVCFYRTTSPLQLRGYVVVVSEHVLHAVLSIRSTPTLSRIRLVGHQRNYRQQLLLGLHLWSNLRSVKLLWCMALPLGVVGRFLKKSKTQLKYGFSFNCLTSGQSETISFCHNIDDTKYPSIKNIPNSK